MINKKDKLKSNIPLFSLFFFKIFTTFVSFFEELQSMSGKGRNLELNMFKNLAMCSFASISAPLKKHPSPYYSQSTVLYL